MVSSHDIHYMKSALALARRGIGRTAENPSVGCLIVKDSIVIARAQTAGGGRPHAETQALKQAGEKAKGATLYVTLEPCTHYGQTPPCCDAIIEAGIARVVIAMDDVDPRVQGRSEEMLEKAGIEVTQYVLEKEALVVNSHFVTRIKKNRPYITLKTALTLDGKMACASGESQWITGSLARRHAHLMRAQHDAILVGIETVLADDPVLSTRLNGIEHKAVRIILDRDLRIPLESKLVQSAKDIPLLVFFEHQSENHDALKAAGVRLHNAQCGDLNAIVKLLSDQGINSVLVEGGATIHASFLCAKLCDELIIYRAPTILGAESKSAIGLLGVETLKHRHDLLLKTVRPLGVDMLERYVQKGES